MAAPNAPRTIRDVVCLGCGCLCDDLEVALDDGGVVAGLGRACERGRAWFHEAERAESVDSGDIVSRLDRAAEMLLAARAPLIAGLSSASIEAQRLAVALADRLGATVDASSSESRARAAAVSRVGRCTATLGEVRARADLVVFWACDPMTSHPRHLERYSAEALGRFVPDGRAGRYLVVVDETPNATSARADETIELRPEHRVAALSVLLARVRGAAVDAGRLVSATGHPGEVWGGLADRLRAARYGVIFTGAALDDPAEFETLMRLVGVLNGRPEGRFVHLTLGEPGNAGGAEAVLGWQAGYAPVVSFGGGRPGPVDVGIQSAQHDLVLAIGGTPAGSRAGAVGVPIVRVGPGCEADAPNVAIPTSALGLGDGGTVMRGDGVSLPVARLRPGALPGLEDVLRALLDRLDRCGPRGAGGS
jgi:formylmethanofuran dehydrogenase subunit B